MIVTEVLQTPEAIGDAMAAGLLRRFAEARAEGRRFLLGSPTGRTPRPVYHALAARLAAAPADLSHVTLVMMDEYLVPGPEGLAHAPAEAPWSCHYFAEHEILAPLRRVLPPAMMIRAENVWFPRVDMPDEYDVRIADAGGIDLFLLASGASDGHVAFNPPGTPRESRTRVIPLSEDTRRDNLQTFPSFGTLDAVPHHGVSVGVATMLGSREAVMVLWGSGKRTTFDRIHGATRYDASWPATLIHECARGRVLADAAAAVNAAPSGR